jgi:MarR family transcriptional regulator, organic hydroperoxide resistance regulator
MHTDIECLQRCYPQIYLACHTRHVRATSTVYRLSARDSSILVHLHPEEPITPTALAAHLGVRGSTLSAAVHRLERLGYLRRAKAAHDRRCAALTLTPQGAKAMSATSVLDQERVAAILRKLTRAQRSRAMQGLELLARASRKLMSELKSGE